VENYVLLNAGSALGFGVGPMLICKKPELAASSSFSKDIRVGIPGKFTTANFLLGLAFPGLVHKQEMVFSAIEQALLDERIDLGLIIHENRFTYQDKGLHKIVDLGDFWERTTGAPIPLGGIVVKRMLPEEIQQRVDRVVRKSVEYAFAHPKSGLDFIRSHAQAMSEAVMYKHIELYVNEAALSVGEEGPSAIRLLFDKAWRLGLIPHTARSLFRPARSPRNHHGGRRPSCQVGCLNPQS